MNNDNRIQSTWATKCPEQNPQTLQFIYHKPLYSVHRAILSVVDILSRVNMNHEQQINTHIYRCLNMKPCGWLPKFEGSYNAGIQLSTSI